MSISPLMLLITNFMDPGSPEHLSGDRAGRVVQINGVEEGVELGQELRKTDSPQFEGMSLFANFEVAGDTTLAGGLLVENDAIFQGTIDAEGALNVNDNQIILNNKGTPTDANADGGGVVLLSDDGGNKTFLWSGNIDAWVFNQDVVVQDRMSVGDLSAPAVDTSIDLKATNKAFLLNRLTAVQRNGLTAEAGMMIYNTDVNGVEFYNGTSWVTIS